MACACKTRNGGMQAGQLVMGEVKSCAGAGVTVHLASGLGFCPLTSLHDAFVPSALEGLSPGQFVRGSIAAAERDDKGRWPLSLRQADGGAHAGARLSHVSARSETPLTEPLQRCTC